MTKAHLEQRLKDLQGNLQLMKSLYIDSETPYALRADLYGQMINRVNEINEVKKQIEDFQLTLVRIDNIFHEPIQFDVREEGGK
jgi:hypothetical protein